MVIETLSYTDYLNKLIKESGLKHYQSLDELEATMNSQAKNKTYHQVLHTDHVSYCSFNK